MPNFDSMMISFCDELTKEALVPARLAGLGTRIVQNTALQRGLEGLGSGMGVGALAGAVGGAGIQGVRGYREAKEMGATGVQALAGGISKGVGGAAKGALIGAGVGGVGLGSAAARGMKTPQLTQAWGPVGSFARFGQRQVHGLTGWTPSGGLHSIRAGTYDPAKRVARAHLALAKAQDERIPLASRVIGAIRNRTPEQLRASHIGRAEKELGSTLKGLRYAGEAQRMGLTSLPGYARSLAKQPLKTLKTGFGEQWHSSDLSGKALVFGLPVAGVASEAMKPTEPGGAGKAERMGKRMGDIAFGMGPLPVSSALLAAPMLGAVGGGAGKLLGKLRGKRPHLPAPPSLEPAGGDTTPGEYVYSDRAMGLGLGGAV